MDCTAHLIHMPCKQLTIDLPSEVFEDVQHLDSKTLRTAVRRTQLLRLAMKGICAKDAARIVGCAQSTATLIYQDPEFRKQALSRMEKAFAGVDAAFVETRRTLHQKIEEQAEKSFDDLVSLLQQDIHPSLKVKIHQDFLNRCEESQPQHKVNVGHQFSPEELQRAALAAREIDANLNAKVVPIRKEKVG